MGTQLYRQDADMGVEFLLILGRCLESSQWMECLTESFLKMAASEVIYL